MRQYQDFKITIIFKIRHCATCCSLLDHLQVRRNSGELLCLRATNIGGFVFTMFLNEVNVVPPSVQHVLYFSCAWCLSSAQCTAERVHDCQCVQNFGSLQVVDGRMYDIC
jgi:hypothetical protein